MCRGRRLLNKTGSLDDPAQQWCFPLLFDERIGRESPARGDHGVVSCEAEEYPGNGLNRHARFG